MCKFVPRSFHLLVLIVLVIQVMIFIRPGGVQATNNSFGFIKTYLTGVKYSAENQAKAAFNMIGLGRDLPEEFVCPTTYVDINGQQLNATQRYRLHFTKEQLPPVGVFWLVRIYDQNNSFFENPLNRYALFGWESLTYNADGSLDFYIQSSSPGKELENNWLPAPVDGVFSLAAHIIAPNVTERYSDWKMPPVQRVN